MDDISFTVDVHYCENGKSPFVEALAEFEDVSDGLRDKVVTGAQRLANRKNWRASGFTEYIAKNVYCMRVRHNGNIARVFFTLFNGVIYLLNGYVKKTRKLLASELDRATKHMKEVCYA